MASLAGLALTIAGRGLPKGIVHHREWLLRSDLADLGAGSSPANNRCRDCLVCGVNHNGVLSAIAEISGLNILRLDWTLRSSIGLWRWPERNWNEPACKRINQPCHAEDQLTRNAS